MLRVQLPDRPGSLGQVATAMGTVGADISAIEIVEKQQGSVINDFMLTMPPNSLPDTLVSACNELPGVQVLWLSRYPENWGLESDIDLLDRISADPARASETLTAHAPVVFHSQWAAVVNADGSSTTSQLAPELDDEAISALGPLDEAATRDLPEGWLPGWGETTIAFAPLQNGSALVLGRQGGPAYLVSEVRRLQHLAGMTL
ncbi:MULTISPECIES: amino acid-binding protein [Aestuariimicrobium]|uniref:amino acid-binding protein n=1 Tax=Aestuariimicrobium TaxID=396388 RepID=UPI00047A1D35|nr:MULTISPECIES: amino acid-binding protein [Aestuariimicrobium]